MPEVDSAGCRIAFDVSGAPDAPVLLLCHALGAHADLWAPQVDAFSQRFRVIRPDMRGHGRSSVPPGEYTIDQLGGDAIAVLDAAGASSAHVCGLSIGGLVAMWLAIHAAGRVARLVAVCTAARVAQADLWTERIGHVRAAGLDAIADAAMIRWFTDDYRQRHPEIVRRHRDMVTSCRTDGYAACCAVLRDTDLSADLPEIGASTLVVSGAHDPVAPPSDGQAIRDRIPRARSLTLESAHMPNVERAEEFNEVVMEFLR